MHSAIAIMRVLRAIARVDVDTWLTKDYTRRIPR
jgi:hypothetical protein